MFSETDFVDGASVTNDVGRQTASPAPTATINKTQKTKRDFKGIGFFQISVGVKRVRFGNEIIVNRILKRAVVAGFFHWRDCTR
ncbi:hypothetical protein RRSWK_06220 [Rhodopirellula sp. SWK7]|nr:hypothetical protein RRSWK_06220 [Rhodopirellula sp. SWK7]